MNRWRLRRLSTRGLLYAGAALLALQAAFPFFWMASTSFKLPAEVFAQPPSFIPQDPTFDNFRRLFTATAFLTYYQAGLGAALAVIMFAILMVTTVIYFGLFREEADIG